MKSHRTLRAGPLAIPLVVAGIVPTVLGLWLGEPALLPAAAFSLPAGVLLMLLGLWMTADSVDRVYLSQNTPLGDLPPDYLVTQGFYRVIRNPMAVGMTLLLIGESLVWSATSIVVWASVVLTVSYVAAARVEEPSLHRTFGAEYLDYQSTTPAWFPAPMRVRSRAQAPLDPAAMDGGSPTRPVRTRQEDNDHDDIP